MSPKTIIVTTLVGIVSLLLLKAIQPREYYGPIWPLEEPLEVAILLEAEKSRLGVSLKNSTFEQRIYDGDVENPQSLIVIEYRVPLDFIPRLSPSKKFSRALSFAKTTCVSWRQSLQERSEGHVIEVTFEAVTSKSETVEFVRSRTFYFDEVCSLNA